MYKMTNGNAVLDWLLDHNNNKGHQINILSKKGTDGHDHFHEFIDAVTGESIQADWEDLEEATGDPDDPSTWAIIDPPKPEQEKLNLNIANYNFINIMEPQDTAWQTYTHGMEEWQ